LIISHFPSPETSPGAANEKPTKEAAAISQQPSGFSTQTMTGNIERQTVTITNPQGLHMRPILAFVEVANRYPGTVTIKRLGSDAPVNGRSPLGLMSLGADQGTELLIEVSGPEARETVQALIDVLQRSFDEE
jgi:phosphotransferase system HPr (HPr) family protein